MNPLRKQIIEKLKGVNIHLSPSTEKLYSETIIRILDRLGVRKLSELSKFEDDIVSENQKYSDQTKKTIFSAFSILLPKSQKIADARADAIRGVNNHYSSRKMSEKQESGQISIDQIKQRKDELYESAIHRMNLTNITDYLIVALMAGGTKNIPPRRLEWVTTKLTDYNPRKDNYFVHENYTFYFNDYKTDSNYAQQKVTISSAEEDLIEMIDYYVKEFGPRKYFFLKNNKNAAFSKSDMSKRFKRIFQKYAGNEEGSITINDCRIAYVNHSFRNNTVLEAEKVAEQMSHSFNTANQFYRKN